MKVTLQVIAGLMCFFPLCWGKSNVGVPPNIILVLTNDQGSGDIQRHGNPFVNTPNINRLFDESAHFSNFVVSPTCAPTPCALMTGKHAFKSGVSHTVSGRREMSLATVTIAEVLKKAAYKTGIFGKWHLGSNGAFRPEKRGFDLSITSVDDTQNAHFNPTLLFNGIPKTNHGFRTDILFNHAMKFIEDHKKEPFFCYLPTYSPHMPLKAPQKYMDENNGNAFYAMISNIDYNVGRLMHKLKVLKLDENTLVVFITDNGATKGTDLYNANMRGCKATPWYGGTRAISCWRWKGHIRPSEITQLAAHIDLFPTVCDFAGIELPKKLKASLDGVSLKPILEQKEATLPERCIISHLGRWPDGAGSVEAHKYAFCSVHYKNYLLVKSQTCGFEDCKGECRVFSGIQENTFESIYSKTKGKFHYAMNPNHEWMLFDVFEDPRQEHNIYGEYPQLVKKMAGAYEDWWKDVFPIIQQRNLMKEQ